MSTTEPEYYTGNDLAKIGKDEEAVAFVTASDIPKDAELYRRGKRHLCSRCKKGEHNNKIVRTRCKGKDCECICQDYYEGLDGKLRVHGEPDDSLKPIPPKKTNPKTEKAIRELNAEWAKLKHT